MNGWRAAIACVMFGAIGCATSDDVASTAPASPAEASVQQTFKRSTAARAAEVLADASVRESVLAELRAKGSVALADLPALSGASTAGLSSEAVPEAWLLDSASPSASDRLLVAYAPGGDEKTWTTITAYTLDGQRVELDAHVAPDAPVLVIETSGRLAMQKGVAEANAKLQQLGLQRTPAKVASADGRWTTKLDSIRLNDDHEPWISGSAEIYAIVSSVIADNAPDVRIVDMPYLDKDGVTYTPNQILIDWTPYAYQAANIQLFEHDDNTNYQTLVSELVSAIGALGSLAGYPQIQAITEIAGRIIAAMPSGWFSNDDDYVDSFYTLEKTKSYSGYQGAGRNATVTLTPYYVQPN